MHKTEATTALIEHNASYTTNRNAHTPFHLYLFKVSPTKNLNQLAVLGRHNFMSKAVISPNQRHFPL